MEELRKFQSSTFDTLTRRKLIEDQNTILELSGRVQELQNEVNCKWTIPRTSRTLSRCAVEIHTLPINQEYSQNIRYLKGLLRPSFVSPRRKEGLPDIWDTHGISGNVLQIHKHFFFWAPYPQELNSLRKKIIEEPLHMSTVEKSERPEQNQDLRCQSGPSF